MRRLFSIVLIFICSCAAIAQQHSLRQYTAVDGLPQSQVSAMLEDAYGYLWIGTQGGGLARFDGQTFKVYNTIDGLLSNTITSLLIDSKQNIWLVHPRGLTRFDGLTFKKFQAPGPSFNLGRIRRIYESCDTTFFVSSPGVLGKIYQDSIYYWYKPIKKDRLIFFGIRSLKKELCLYLNDSSFYIIRPDGTRISVSHKAHFGKVNNIFNYGKKLIIDSDKGMFTFDKKYNLVREELTVKNRIVAYDTTSSTFWTRNNNALLKEQAGANAPVDTVLKDISLSQILFDREGNTWIGTSGFGLYKYYVRDFDRCASDKLGSVMAITKDKHNATWLGTMNRGLWRIGKGKPKNYLSSAKENNVTTIKVSPTNEIWVGSFLGLGKYDSVADNFVWHTREHGLSSQYILSLEIDKKGRIWSGTSNSGVDLIEGKKVTNFSVRKGLNSHGVYSLKYFEKNHALYVGTDLGLNVITDDLKVTSLPIPELENTTVYSLNTYKDSLILIGSSGAGLIIYDPVNHSRKKISAREGLPSNLIYFVGEDEEHFLWIGTEQGISRIRLGDNLEIVQNFHFGYENGLSGVEANHNAFYLGKEKYFGLIDGVYQYNKAERYSKVSNQLHITDVDLFYGEEPVQSYSSEKLGFFKLPSHLSLPPDKNHITFSFSRVDKRNPRSVQYKYFLENYDKTWSLPVANGRVTYGNLPPGNYILNIMATNKDGSWDEAPIKFPVEVRAPFYKTGLFVIVSSLTLVGIIFLTLFWRVRHRVNKMLEIERIRQSEQENLRKQIARDFHDEMGNQLSRIINYISLMKLSNGHAHEFYNKVEDSAKYLYNGTRDFIWSIDPGNDVLSKVFIHIRDFGDKLFEEKNMVFRAFNEVKGEVKVPYGFCREATLIFKEAMTNAFNHSKARNISFSLLVVDNDYVIKLHDDGIGFSSDSLKRPNGLNNMRSRSERIKSSLEVKSIPGQGTEVSLRITLNKKSKYEYTI